MTMEDEFSRLRAEVKSTEDEGSSVKSSQSSDEGLSIKSSTESSKSSSDLSINVIEEEEPYNAEEDDRGPKRKADDYADDDSCFESEYEEDEEDEEDSEEDDLMEEDLKVTILDDYGVPIPDEEIMDWMTGDRRPLEEKEKLIPRIRRYIKSIHDSEGFDCSHYPGNIPGVTSIVPRQSLITDRHRNPEGYNHLFYMSSLALKEYNKKNKTKFMVQDVENVTVRPSMENEYYLTFKAICSLSSSTLTFQVKGYDDSLEQQLSVGFCRPKSVPESFEKSKGDEDEEERSYDKSAGNEEWSDNKPMAVAGNKSDILTELSILRVSESKILGLIKGDRRTRNKDPNKLAAKVFNYLESIHKSKGFKCTDYPGYIPGLTILIPRQKIIDQPSCYPECYNHLRLMPIWPLSLT